MPVGRKELAELLKSSIQGAIWNFMTYGIPLDFRDLAECVAFAQKVYLHDNYYHVKKMKRLFGSRRVLEMLG